jgi:hypothetical protein
LKENILMFFLYITGIIYLGKAKFSRDSLFGVVCTKPARLDVETNHILLTMHRALSTRHGCQALAGSSTARRRRAALPTAVGVVVVALSQYPLSMSPFCGVKPMMDSMESAAQQLCSMTRMARQHPGPGTPRP